MEKTTNSEGSGDSKRDAMMTLTENLINLFSPKQTDAFVFCGASSMMRSGRETTTTTKLRRSTDAPSNDTLILSPVQKPQKQLKEMLVVRTLLVLWRKEEEVNAIGVVCVDS